jgi:small-conductance mechanosensitive channel
MPSPTQSEISKGALPVKKLVELITIDPANLKNNKPQSGQARLDTRILLVLAAITFCIGVAATLVWQSRGDAARKTIASAFSRLGWLAPQVGPVAQSAPDTFAPVASAAPSPDQQPTAPPLDLDAVRQSVDQIAAGQEQMTRSVEQIAASQEQMARMVGQLTASQEQLTREITKLQAIEQYILYKNSEPSAPKPNPRPR